MSKPWSYKKIVKEFLKNDTKVLLIGEMSEFLEDFIHEPSLVTIFDESSSNFESSFDLVLCKSRKFSTESITSCLKKGGHFITEQNGTNEKNFNLENQVPVLEESGFRIVTKNQYYKNINYTAKDQGQIFIIVAKKF